MTPEQGHREPGHERQHEALMAVTRALTENEAAVIIARAARWPGMDGAGVADVLDHTVDQDEFLNRTEPFFMAHDKDFDSDYGPAYAAHALILLGRELTVEAVRELLARAAVQAGRRDAAERTARALTDGQGVEITHTAVELGFPRESLPARVQDVLGWLAGKAAGAASYAQFNAAHEDELPDDWYPAFAMTALMALGEPLTMDAVTDLMRRARNGDAPYDPVPDLAHVLFRLRSMGGGYAPSMAVALANLKKAGIAGTAAEIEARLRDLGGRRQ
jgi:hypothetical protein